MTWNAGNVNKLKHAYRILTLETYHTYKIRTPLIWTILNCTFLNCSYFWTEKLVLLHQSDRLISLFTTWRDMGGMRGLRTLIAPGFHSRISAHCDQNPQICAAQDNLVENKMCQRVMGGWVFIIHVPPTHRQSKTLPSMALPSSSSSKRSVCSSCSDCCLSVSMLWRWASLRDCSSAWWWWRRRSSNSWWREQRWGEGGWWWWWDAGGTGEGRKMGR